MKRVYCPLNKDYAIETPYVEYNGGKRSFQPVKGQPQIVLIDEVRKSNLPLDEGLQKDLKAFYPNGVMGEDKAQISLQVSASGATGKVRLGLYADSFGIFGGAAPSADVTIGGKWGANTVQVIGDLAKHGLLQIERIHAEADDKTFFANNMQLKTVKHNGTCVGDEEIYWTKVSSKDENVEIRDNYFDNSPVMLNGMNYLEITVADGTAADLTLYTNYRKCCA